MLKTPFIEKSPTEEGGFSQDKRFQHYFQQLQSKPRGEIQSDEEFSFKKFIMNVFKVLQEKVSKEVQEKFQKKRDFNCLTGQFYDPNKEKTFQE